MELMHLVIKRKTDLKHIERDHHMLLYKSANPCKSSFFPIILVLILILFKLIKHYLKSEIICGIRLDDSSELQILLSGDDFRSGHGKDCGYGYGSRLEKQACN